MDLVGDLDLEEVAVDAQSHLLSRVEVISQKRKFELPSGDRGAEAIGDCFSGLTLAKQGPRSGANRSPG